MEPLRNKRDISACLDRGGKKAFPHQKEKAQTAQWRKVVEVPKQRVDGHLSGILWLQFLHCMVLD